jgi:hypothetical protein
LQTIPLAGVTKISQPNFTDLDEQQMDTGMGTSFKTRTVLDTSEDSTFDPSIRVFLASKSGIFALCMRHFKLQAQELQSNRDYEQALFLCDVVEGTKQQVEKWRINSIHLDYGFYLFTRGDFDGAMEHFASNTEADPRMVLSLFPDLLPSTPSSYAFKTFTIPSSTIEERNKIENMMKDPQLRQQALSALIQYLLCRVMPSGTNLTQNELDVAEAVDTALLKSYLYTNEDVTSFLGTCSYF